MLHLSGRDGGELPAPHGDRHRRVRLERRRRGAVPRPPRLGVHDQGPRSPAPCDADADAGDDGGDGAEAEQQRGERRTEATAGSGHVPDPRRHGPQARRLDARRPARRGAGRGDLARGRSGPRTIPRWCARGSGSSSPESGAWPASSSSAPATRLHYAGSVLSYLDAGTGSMLAAALAGGVAGIGVLMRMYGNRVLGVVSRKRRAKAAAARAQLTGSAQD